MKYLKLNGEFTTEDYGHYVSFSEETGKITYDFKYGNITLKSLYLAIEGLKSLGAADDDIYFFGKSKTDSYNTSTWLALLGGMDNDLYNILDKKYPWFPNVKTITLDNGDVIDAPHFWASMLGADRGYLDLCGWAGDIVQRADDIRQGDTSGKFPAGSFGVQDWNADIDAHNLYYLVLSEGGLLNAMKAYYTSGLTEKVRCQGFLSKGTGVKSRFNSPYNTQGITALRAAYYPNVTDAHINLACEQMQGYLNKYR